MRRSTDSDDSAIYAFRFQQDPCRTESPRKVVKNAGQISRGSNTAIPSPSLPQHPRAPTPSQLEICRLENHSVPSPYLTNAYSRLEIHNLIAKTATTVFPLASQSFIDRLMLSAMRTPPLLYALLASFGSHHARRMTSSCSESEKTTLMFTNQAISGLRAALAHDDASKTLKADTLMTAMALCTNDVCNGNLDVFRMHMKAIRQMLLSFIRSLPAGDKSLNEDLLNLYLIKWFAALDVSANLSLFNRGGQYELEEGEGEAVNYWTSHEIFNPSEDVVDDICGYSLNLVPIFSEIGTLARARYESLSNGRIHSLDEESDSILTSKAHTLELHLKSLPSPKISTGIWTDQQRQLVEELRDTHPAFVYTALLHLHRRVQLLPKSHPEVRNDVTNILGVVKNVRPFSPVNVLLIWPLFSAGCETDSPPEKAVIDERMSIMQSLGMGNFTRGREALNRFWESGTELRWDVYLSRSGVDLVLF
ncbi:Protein of unknown function DUF3468 [Penicillium occitanis (nom. inval.)]|nr:Protein of unknown function DUF3468 [Penicillium occitanis (nom. inval.)]PCH06371.1 hypothetical protein PENOC_024080 [Penicillium occitanis (nom. inval.)]